MAKTQIHEAKVTITRQLVLPQYEDGGVVLELRADQKLLGTVTFSGAHVYFQYHRMKKHWNFSQFVDLLKNA